MTERHLWLNLSGIWEKDRTFLLDAPLSPSGLFGDSFKGGPGGEEAVSHFQAVFTSPLSV